MSGSDATKRDAGAHVGAGAGAGAIPGYDYGTTRSAVSPVTEEELRHLEEAAGWTAGEAALLRKHEDLFRKHAGEMVDSWRGRIAKQRELAQYFFGPDGKPDEFYKSRARERFVRWVVDVAVRPHDRDWLNYQEEIGLRHLPARKNAADGTHTPALVPLRYLIGFIPMVLPVEQFFAGDIQDAAELDALQRAWTASLLLHVSLWTRPYSVPGLW
jgi:hypothetical protein